MRRLLALLAALFLPLAAHAQLATLRAGGIPGTTCITSQMLLEAGGRVALEASGVILLEDNTCSSGIATPSPAPIASAWFGQGNSALSAPSGSTTANVGLALGAGSSTIPADSNGKALSSWTAALWFKADDLTIGQVNGVGTSQTFNLMGNCVTKACGGTTIASLVIANTAVSTCTANNNCPQLPRNGELLLYGKKGTGLLWIPVAPLTGSQTGLRALSNHNYCAVASEYGIAPSDSGIGKMSLSLYDVTPGSVGLVGSVLSATNQQAGVTDFYHDATGSHNAYTPAQIGDLFPGLAAIVTPGSPPTGPNYASAGPMGPFAFLGGIFPNDGSGNPTPAAIASLCNPVGTTTVQTFATANSMTVKSLYLLGNDGTGAVSLADTSGNSLPNATTINGGPVLGPPLAPLPCLVLTEQGDGDVWTLDKGSTTTGTATISGTYNNASCGATITGIEVAVFNGASQVGSWTAATLSGGKFTGKVTGVSKSSDFIYTEKARLTQAPSYVFAGNFLHGVGLKWAHIGQSQQEYFVAVAGGLSKTFTGKGSGILLINTAGGSTLHKGVTPQNYGFGHVALVKFGPDNTQGCTGSPIVDNCQQANQAIGDGAIVAMNELYALCSCVSQIIPIVKDGQPVDNWVYGSLSTADTTLMVNGGNTLTPSTPGTTTFVGPLSVSTITGGTGCVSNCIYPGIGLDSVSNTSAIINGGFGAQLGLASTGGTGERATYNKGFEPEIKSGTAIIYDSLGTALAQADNNPDPSTGVEGWVDLAAHVTAGSLNDLRSGPLTITFSVAPTNLPLTVQWRTIENSSNLNGSETCCYNDYDMWGLANPPAGYGAVNWDPHSTGKMQEISERITGTVGIEEFEECTSIGNEVSSPVGNGGSNLAGATAKWNYALFGRAQEFPWLTNDTIGVAAGFTRGQPAAGPGSASVTGCRYLQQQFGRAYNSGLKQTNWLNTGGALKVTPGGDYYDGLTTCSQTNCLGPHPGPYEDGIRRDGDRLGRWLWAAQKNDFSAVTGPSITSCTILAPGTYPKTLRCTIALNATGATSLATCGNTTTHRMSNGSTQPLTGGPPALGPPNDSHCTVLDWSVVGNTPCRGFELRVSATTPTNQGWNETGDDEVEPSLVDDTKTFSCTITSATTVDLTDTSPSPGWFTSGQMWVQYAAGTPLAEAGSVHAPVIAGVGLYNPNQTVIVSVGGTCTHAGGSPATLSISTNGAGIISDAHRTNVGAYCDLTTATYTVSLASLTGQVTPGSVTITPYTVDEDIDNIGMLIYDNVGQTGTDGTVYSPGNPMQAQTVPLGPY